MAPPTLLIVPGSYTSSLAYYDLIRHIHRLYPSLPEPLVYDLPSASSGPPIPPPTLYDDGDYFSEKVGDLADTGADIVVFAHSYGGAPAREAVKGHSKGERTKQGKKGGVVRLVYLSALTPAPGQSVSEVCSALNFDFLQPVQEVSLIFPRLLNGDARLSLLKLTQTNWQGSTDYFRHVIPISAARCFSDLPQAEAIKMAARATIHSSVSFMNPVTELSDHDRAIPSTYILLTKDEVLPPDLQNEQIEVLKSQSGADKVQVVQMQTGHCPNASAPEELAQVVGSILSA